VTRAAVASPLATIVCSYHRQLRAAVAVAILTYPFRVLLPRRRPSSSSQHGGSSPPSEHAPLVAYAFAYASLLHHCVMSLPSFAVSTRHHVPVRCSYEGRVVAKLPFEPFSLLTKITRRGIEDTKDLTSCAWVRTSNPFQTSVFQRVALCSSRLTVLLRLASGWCRRLVMHM